MFAAMERARRGKTAHGAEVVGAVGQNGPLEDQDGPWLVKVLGQRALFPVWGDREQRIAAIARVQRGRVKRQQLLAAGIAPMTIKNMVRRALLVSEHAGVYALAYAPDVPLGRETAALLACGDRAMLRNRSAGTLWGLVPTRRGPVEVTIVGGDRGRKRAGITIRRVAGMLNRDVTIHEGLPVTSPARTLLDLCAEADVREAERVLDEALVVREIVRRGELVDVVERARNHPGKALLRELIRDRTESRLTESEAERRFLELVRKAGLPLPETQVPFDGFRLDFLWRELGVVFEIDGRRYHSSRSAFNNDRRKDAAVKAANMDPNHLARDEVEYRPLYAIAQVAGALALARGRRARGGGP